MKLTGYYTKAGEKIAAGLLAGKTLSVAKITAGSGSTDTDAAQLDQEKQDLGPCTPEVSGTTAVIRCTLTSTQAKEPYFLRELGVYALDDTGRKVLYLIFRLDEEVSIHPSFRLVLRFNLEQTLSDGAGIEVTAPLTGVATQEDLKTKADLTGGQVPYQQMPHLEANRNLYVDAASGDDANPGTQEQPFKTIQAAINSLPKDLWERTVFVYVAPGVYEENVVISGFTAGNQYQGISVQGAEYLDDSRKIKSLKIVNCTTQVKVTGVSVFGQNNNYAVTVSNSPAVLSKVTVKKGDDGAERGIVIGGYAPAQAMLKDCLVDGYVYGILVDYTSVASIMTTTVKNCTRGVECGSSVTATPGIGILYNVTFNGNTTNTSTYYSGQIFGGV